MSGWHVIDRGEIPRLTGHAGQGTEISDRSQLTLHGNGTDYSIRVDKWELMNNVSTGSEQLLATAACRRLEVSGVYAAAAAGDRPPPCLMVGGLGMGFTLRATLDHSPPTSTVVIAELVPDIIRWNQQHLGHLAGHPLEDPRVEIHLDDVAARIRSHPEGHDAIMLDVDNGPHDTGYDDNNSASEGWIYTPEGLATIRESLRPKGVLTIWAAGPCRGFVARLEREGFKAEERRHYRHGSRTNEHRVWLAQRD